MHWRHQRSALGREDDQAPRAGAGSPCRSGLRCGISLTDSVSGVPQFDVIKAYGDAPDVCISDEHQAMCVPSSGSPRAGLLLLSSHLRVAQAARACGRHGVCCGGDAAWDRGTPGAGASCGAAGVCAGAARGAARAAKQVALDAGRGAEPRELALAGVARARCAGLRGAVGLGGSANQTAKRKTLLIV